MLRSFFIYLSKASWAQSLIMGWGIAWRTASRFIAGTGLEDALQAVRKLNARGINTTLDHLGEHTESVEAARQAADSICSILEALERTGICSNVSIKLTQIGMGLDTDLCHQNLARVCETAREKKNFVRIDIEDTRYTDQTFELYDQMRSLGFDNLGVAIQAYLYRSANDARELLAKGASIRLVKGAYQEPPDKAYPQKKDVDANFDLLARMLLDSSLAADSRLSDDCRIPPVPAIATHDEARIRACVDYAERIGLPKNGLEFQLLYGIRRDLQERLASHGYPVRIYVPFGAHWYPYYMRRLAERPANIWFFVSNFFHK